MDSTTPLSEPRSRTKSASRLSKLRHYSDETGSPVIPQLSLEIVPSSPKISTPSPASTISPRPPYTLSLHELLMQSPSPLKRSKTRLDMADDASPLEPSGVRKRCKTRNSQSGCGVSPRSIRRSRRRLDQEVREERETVVAGEELLAKPRKKRQSRKEKQISTQLVPLNRTVDGASHNLDAIGEIINDLVMWKDVAKSSLWFGFGSLCFLSSCFAKGVSFSIFSFLSQVGLLFLGVSFLSNSVRQREAAEMKREFKLKDDDILRVGRLILPAANLVISKTREIFSGEPAMTLKVVPFLLVGAEYGHLITLWRLCALGFFVSFTGPKLYSYYSPQLSKKVEYVKSWAFDAWGSCTHKKIVAASVVTAFWNLTSIRTRIFAAFLCLVILRYRRQHPEAVANDEANATDEKQEQEKALVALEIESKK
ncbi:Reticulon family protein [Perilla frutescens var. hirtella]|uniref:Reticulon-like protein n=1 Tax=Perilla frutescens var. hirtella TaxID=608512 RepID=A0AAD4JII4_PERFH|nr:Reticulon family protein [Perilla frutescens var. hirtella]